MTELEIIKCMEFQIQNLNTVTACPSAAKNLHLHDPKSQLSPHHNRSNSGSCYAKEKRVQPTFVTTQTNIKSKQRVRISTNSGSIWRPLELTQLIIGVVYYTTNHWGWSLGSSWRPLELTLNPLSYAWNRSYTFCWPLKLCLLIIGIKLKTPWANP